eukprot:2728725-Rhodomonas_salina.1
MDDEYSSAFSAMTGGGDTASRRRSITASEVESVRTGYDREPADCASLIHRPSVIRTPIRPEVRVPLDDLAFLRLHGGSPTALSHCLLPIVNDGTELLVAVQRTVYLVASAAVSVTHIWH